MKILIQHHSPAQRVHDRFCIIILSCT